MQYFPNGSQFAVSAGLGAPIPITAITNADPAVATAVGVNTGDYVVVESGWGGINNRATQAGTVVDDDVPLIGLDTSEADRYPQDTFTGNLRIASGFFGLSQITDLDKSGGEQQV